MTSIPLLCNICPKQPQFSDLSHLLTHVSSKGHLSHYFRAQVRGRHDENVHHSVETYDNWYQTHGIEQLLSQRMATKESRKPGRYFTAGSKTSQRQAMSRRRQMNVSPSPDNSKATIKHEHAIDPRLFQIVRPSNLDQSSTCGSEHPSVPSRRQAYIPHMSDWQTSGETDPRRNTSVSADPGLDNVSEISVADNDRDLACFRDFLRSPTRLIYPDPSEIHDPVGQEPEYGRALSPPQTRRQTLAQKRVEEGDDGSEASKSPLLKGIRYPGMAIFDSANSDTQRLRNQKKDGSVLEQMEHNSSAVEPLEVIYWPEGTLKKSRLITGNVESSQSGDSPPPMPKRRRVKASRPRQPLIDLDQNIPASPRKRGRKAKTTAPREDKSNACYSREPSRAETRSPGKGIDSDDTESLVVSRQHTGWPNCRKLRVYRDSTLERASPTANRSRSSRNVTNLDDRPSRSHSTLAPRSRHGHLMAEMASCRSRHHETTPLGCSLNRPEDLLGESSLFCGINATAESQVVEAPIERATQRYFSITSNEEPQFYDAMPPQMEFGGMVGPRYLGSTLNPLNPIAHSRHLRATYTSFMMPPYGTFGGEHH